MPRQYITRATPGELAINRAIGRMKRKGGRITKRKRRLPKLDVRNPFPRRKFCVLKYVDNISFSTTGTGLPAVYSFRTNSLHDPDYTSAGHQCYMYDELSSVYNHYKVHGLRYKITFLDSTYNWILNRYLTVDTAYNPALADADVNAEKRGARSELLSLRAGKYTMKGFVQNSKLFGVSKKSYQDEENYGADIGSDPTNVGFLTMLAQTTDSQLSASIAMYVELQYFCEFTEPKVASAS